MSPPSFLILDLDDTLYDAESAYAYALQSVAFQELAISQSAFQTARQAVKKQLGEGHVSARNRILYFKQLLDQNGRYSPRTVLELMQIYEERISEHISQQWQRLGRKKLFEGPLARIPKVILTNENLRTQMIKLRSIDPEGVLFPRVITSEEKGVEKPSNLIFKEALQWLGCDPDHCLMVGDNLMHDIIPASELGMRSLMTIEFRQSDLEKKLPEGSQRIQSLEAIESYFS